MLDGCASRIVISKVFEIDSMNYQVAIATAEANVSSKLADMRLKQTKAARRADLTTLSTFKEELESYRSGVAAAAYAGALAALSQVRINQERTRVLSR